MSNFLTSIHINKIFHLENIDIPIDDKEKKHLIITGRNGSGKTSLLNALVDFFQGIIKEKQISLLRFGRDVTNISELFRKATQESSTKIYSPDEVKVFKSWEGHLKSKQNRLKPEFLELINIFFSIQSGNFIVAFYAANRKTKVVIPKSPEKPDLSPVKNITDSKQSEFFKISS